MPDLVPYLWILWLALAFAFVVIELLSLEFVFLMLAVGSLGGLVASLAGAPWWLQIVIVLVVSVVLLVTLRPALLRALRRGQDPTPSNVDALLGLAGRVVAPVGEGTGLVKLANGDTWSARPAVAGSRFETGTAVTVTAIEGSIAVVAVARGNPEPSEQPARKGDV